MDTPIDAVIHVGAIAENQSERDDIYLWNSYATFLLAQRVSQKMHSMFPIPFIFFFDLFGRKHDGRLGSTLTVYMVKSAGGELCQRVPAARDDPAPGHHVGQGRGGNHRRHGRFRTGWRRTSWSFCSKTGGGTMYILMMLLMRWRTA